MATQIKERYPWRVTDDDAVFAGDLLRAIPIERLLAPTGHVSHEAMLQIRRAIQNTMWSTATG